MHTNTEAWWNCSCIVRCINGQQRRWRWCVLFLWLLFQWNEECKNILRFDFFMHIRYSRCFWSITLTIQETRIPISVTKRFRKFSGHIFGETIFHLEPQEDSLGIRWRFPSKCSFTSPFYSLAVWRFHASRNFAFGSMFVMSLCQCWKYPHWILDLMNPGNGSPWLWCSFD